MLLGETEQGAPRPHTPRGRAISPAPFLRRRKLFPPSSFRTKLWDPKREPTGAMKMQKKAGQESTLSCRFFLIFPGCKASGRRCFTPPARGWLCHTQFAKSQLAFCKGVSAWRQWRIQLAKIQSSSAKGFLRGGSAAANSQSHNVPFAKGFLRVAVAHPIRKNTFVLCKSMCACYVVSPGHCSCVENCYFRYWVKGQCPLWGAGAKPRMVPHAPPRNCMKDTVCCIRNWVQGTALVSLLGCGVKPRMVLHASPGN